MFDKLKKTLLESGYQVILTDNVARGRGRARGVKGYIVPDDLRIYINKSIGVNDRVETLIHELLHEVYPTWGEQRINRSAKRTFKDLTVSQLGFLQFFIMAPIEIKRMLKANHLSPAC
ncbi:TPA: hypothetical protein DIV45_01705 [Patescibacteria group bacterium]|uniref:IrrE N-terminal-like domain-containing protein n=1 Tax=candidate division Kazan bacterium GW2011_GWA1_44_22 TaxID=1620410 RepID=A0A0G1I0N9_UNCK3|nr:MAG: hypothetical protein VE96_C0004G0003 [candidate division Kazan bacterium GW2011_GWA1_44_22]HCR42062.1 hypothetical protein [Patescibacteria group bacterium]